MSKILVINGHGEKKSTKFQINAKHKIITPGPAEDSYVLSFDNWDRHLEEMTSQNKIWPIQSRNQPIQWHRYSNEEMSDVAIEPLQYDFEVSMFADSVLQKQTRWEQLTNPAHDVMACGAIAEKLADGRIVIHEGQDLKEYLEQLRAGTHQGSPLFFCDKALGKVKPMGAVLLSELYTSIALIEEFKDDGTEIIVATCSPSTGSATTRISVQTYQPATDISSTTFKEKPQAKVEKSQEQAQREAAERAAQEQAQREAAERAAQEQAQREAAERAAQEKVQEKAVAMSDEEYNVFHSLLDEFNSLKNELVERASVNPKYSKVANTATQLSTVLETSLEKFHKQPSDKNLAEFKKTYGREIRKAKDIFEKHRGWHQIDVTIRSILGVLAAITVLPALAVSAITKHGYIGTFYKTPETNSICKVNELKEKIDKLTYPMS